MDIIKYKKEYIIKKIGSGVESNVFLYNDSYGNKVALKIFKKEYTIRDKKITLTDNILQNKEKN